MIRAHNDDWRRCGDCAGWDGGPDAKGKGECLWRRREVGAQELACPDYFKMPTSAQMRSLR